MTQDEIDNALRDMRAKIRELDLVEYADFLNYCDFHNPTWAHMLNTRYSNVIFLYLKSRRHSNPDRRDIDPLTGAFLDD